MERLERVTAIGGHVRAYTPGPSFGKPVGAGAHESQKRAAGGSGRRWQASAPKDRQNAIFIAEQAGAFGSRKRLYDMTPGYVRMFGRVRPKGGLALRTHVRLKQPIVVQAGRPRRPLPGPLVPAARGRPRRRLGGRLGRARPGRWGGRCGGHASRAASRPCGTGATGAGAARAGASSRSPQELRAGDAQRASRRAGRSAQTGGTARGGDSRMPLPHLGVHRRDVRRQHGRPCRRAGA